MMNLVQPIMLIVSGSHHNQPLESPILTPTVCPVLQFDPSI